MGTKSESNREAALEGTGSQANCNGQESLHICSHVSCLGGWHWGACPVPTLSLLCCQVVPGRETAVELEIWRRLRMKVVQHL